MSHIPRIRTEVTSRRPATTDDKRIKICLLALVLFSIAACLRLVSLDADPPAYRLTGSGTFATDEGNWSFVAKELASGHNPIDSGGFLPGFQALAYTAVQFLSIKNLGIGLVAARLPTALLGAVTPALIFLWGRRFLGTWPAFCAAALMATSQWLVMYQRTALSDATMASWAAPTLVAWEAGLATRSNRFAVLAGVLAGITVCTKISAAPLIVAIVLAISLLWLLRDRRSEIQRMATGFGTGLLAVGVLVGFIYLLRPEWAAAAVDTYGYVPLAPSQDARTFAGDLYDAAFKNAAFHFSPFVTLSAYLTIGAALAALFRRRLPPVSICALAWLPTTYLMLALKGYEPTRYYLQLVPPLTILAVQGWCWWWRQTKASPQLRRVIHVGAFLLMSFEIGQSTSFYNSWLVEREYTQRDIGRMIATHLEDPLPEALVAGQVSHNLALSGGFRSAGAVVRHPRFFNRIVDSGATHYVSPGPASEQDLQTLRELDHSLEVIDSYTYLRNYFEPHVDLVLYRLVQVSPED